MIYSMTGYAVASTQLRAGGLQVELRAVNHRYLDVSIRVPDELRALETGLREQLSAALRRGKVECRVTLSRSVPDAATLAIDGQLVHQLGALGHMVRQQVPDCTPMAVADILRWPGVVVEPAVSLEELAKATGELAQSALAEFTASRQREGEKIKTAMDAFCDRMEELVGQIAPRLPDIQIAYQDKLVQRLREAELPTEDERLRQEVALFATKIDVAEELSRLQTHITEVRRVLATGSERGGSAGKRLDFLMQELNREANTLGAKSVDAALSHTALELKVVIEQMREQVQNIE